VDIEPFKKRHFLHSPVRRLAPGTWAQVKFGARGRLASAIQGEEIKDSYKVTGRSLLQIVTGEGNFDYEVPVDATIFDVPF
jgi:hypothetical protein